MVNKDLLYLLKNRTTYKRSEEKMYCRVRVRKCLSSYYPLFQSKYINLLAYTNSVFIKLLPRNKLEIHSIKL